MTSAHKGQILSLQNRVIPVDDDTIFLAHYDLTENDVLKGIKPTGYKKVLGANGSEGNFICSIPHSDSYNLRDTLTIEFWLKMDAAHTGYSLNIAKETSTSDANFNFYMFGNYLGNGAQFNVTFYATAGGGWSNVSGQYVMTQGKWTHIAFVYNSSLGGLLYINGQPIGSRTSIGVLSTNTAPITMSIPQGAIYDFKLWNREKTQDEILYGMYNDSNEDASGLVGWWKLNEEDGEFVYDQTSEGNHGTIKDGSWKEGPIIAPLRVDGYFGGGISVQESTTNLYGNPEEVTSFERPDPIISAVNDSSFSPNGHNVFRITKPVGTPQPWASFRQCVVNTANIDYTLSFMVKMISGGAVSDRIVSHFGGGNSSSIYNVHVGNGWYFCRATGQRTDTAGLCAGVGFIGDAALECLVAEMMLEQKSFPTSYSIGSRSTGRLEYDDIINGPEGTISFWYKPIYDISDGTRRDIFQIVDSATENSNNRMVLMKSSANNLNFQIYRDGAIQASFDSNITGKMGWMFIAITWKSGQIRFYIDGVYMESTGNTMPATRYHIKFTEWNYLFQTNAIFDEVRTDRIARTDDEIMSWYQSGSPFYPKGIYKWAY